MDSIYTIFKTEKEGYCPSHSIILGRGRIFVFDCLDEKGDILSPQEYLSVFENVRGALNRDRKVGDGIGVLTCDDRTNWAINRKKLLELSANNRKILELIESSMLVISLDDQCPNDYTEAVADIMGGNLVTRWADKSLNYVSFANGKIGCVGEVSNKSVSIVRTQIFENKNNPKTIIQKTLSFDQENNLFCSILVMMELLLFILARSSWRAWHVARNQTGAP